MKASQVIREALINHYDGGRRIDFYSDTVSPFMCHSVEFVLASHDRVELEHAVKETFLSILGAARCRTLMDFLKNNDKDYQEAYLNSDSHYSSECYELRVTWWNAHIAELESKGL